MNELRIVTRSPDETRAAAARLLAELPDRRVYALHGDLGSGKTCFVQGLALALGIRQIVTSPTFTIMNEYRGSRTLYHMDLYRINSPEEALSLGIEDYLSAEGIVAIEWAERSDGVFPAETVDVKFEPTTIQDERRITVSWKPSRPVSRPVHRSGS